MERDTPHTHGFPAPGRAPVVEPAADPPLSEELETHESGASAEPSSLAEPTIPIVKRKRGSNTKRIVSWVLAGLALAFVGLSALGSSSMGTGSSQGSSSSGGGSSSMGSGGDADYGYYSDRYYDGRLYDSGSDGPKWANQDDDLPDVADRYDPYLESYDAPLRRSGRNRKEDFWQYADTPFDENPKSGLEADAAPSYGDSPFDDPSLAGSGGAAGYVPYGNPYTGQLLLEWGAEYGMGMPPG